MIVNSTHTVGHAQIDGRRYIAEQHTDHLANVYIFEYLAGSVNYVAIRTARAVQLERDLAWAEAEEVINAA
jgi:hypothetical protein